MSELINSLRDVYPILVGSGVAIAFVHLVDKQSKPEKIPPVARFINVLGAIFASLCAVAASFVALHYAGFYTKQIMVGVSYVLLWSAFLFLILAFITPIAMNFVGPLWVRFYYSQFERAQAKDVEEVREAMHGDEETDENTVE